MKFQLSLGLVAVALSLALVQAAPVAPSEIKAKASQGLRLLSIEDGAEPVWKTEEEKLNLKRQGVNFFDVTETYEVEQRLRPARVPATTYPAPSHQSAVTPILSTLSISNMQSYLTPLAAFNNRYYTASTGADASNWILSKLQSIAGSRSGVSVALFKHSWVQSSVIAKIAGKTSGPVTILSAHLDSINLSNPKSGRAPGMDDDGTGVVNLIEAFRALLAAGFTPSTPVEFHFYAGEEAGLLGSQAIASSYKSAGVSVKAVMQLDMSGYFRPGSSEVIALTADYIDSGLNSYLKVLGASYTRLPVVLDEPCGYACSDHASWYKYGYPASAPYEAVTGDDNPNIHGSGDTTSISGFSWTHSLEFAKLATAFVYEMAI